MWQEPLDDACVPWESLQRVLAGEVVLDEDLGGPVLLHLLVQSPQALRAGGRRQHHLLLPKRKKITSLRIKTKGLIFFLLTY